MSDKNNYTLKHPMKKIEGEIFMCVDDAIGFLIHFAEGTESMGDEEGADSMEHKSIALVARALASGFDKLAIEGLMEIV